MHYRSVIMGINPECRVQFGSGSPSDQKRNVEACPGHLCGDIGHFLKRRCYKATESDNGCVLTDGGCNNLFSRNHNSQINNFIIIALQNNPDNIFTNVVDIPLDSCQHYLSSLR